MSKQVLEVEFDFDFSLFGISCHSANYRLAWALNKNLDLDLERTDDIELSFGESTGFFSFYKYDDEESYTTYHLISNRSDAGYLIPEMKQIDFFLQYWGPMSEADLAHLPEDLRKVTSVLTAINIDPMSLKNRNNLLF